MVRRRIDTRLSKPCHSQNTTNVTTHVEDGDCDARSQGLAKPAVHLLLRRRSAKTYTLGRPMEDAQQQQQQQHMELEREVGDRRRGRPILVAVDHSPKSKHAFDWTIAHLCRLADTLHLVHVLPNPPGDKINSSHESPQALFEATSALMEKLAVEAYEIAMVKTEVQIVSGEVGKAIVDEAKRINPIAVVLGRHGHGILKSVLQGSVSEYCSHHCPCPVVLVPPKKQGDQSVL